MLFRQARIHATLVRDDVQVISLGNGGLNEDRSFSRLEELGTIRPAAKLSRDVGARYAHVTVEHRIRIARGLVWWGLFPVWLATGLFVHIMFRIVSTPAAVLIFWQYTEKK